MERGAGFAVAPAGVVESFVHAPSVVAGTGVFAIVFVGKAIVCVRKQVVFDR